MSINKLIKTNLKKFGLAVERYPQRDLKRRITLISHHKINIIFDVGANTGQYSKLMKQLGYNGSIVSFEPMKKAYEKLQETSSPDSSWIALNYGVGDSNEDRVINISENSVSSSFLEMLPVHTEVSPESKYVDQEKVKIITLDSIYDNYCNNEDQVFLKIDTQGFEKKVLDGARESLKKIKGLQIELCLSKTYKGEIFYLEIINYLNDMGFSLYSIEPGYGNRETGQLYQFDGIFFKNP